MLTELIRPRDSDRHLTHIAIDFRTNDLLFSTNFISYPANSPRESLSESGGGGFATFVAAPLELTKVLTKGRSERREREWTVM